MKRDKGSISWSIIIAVFAAAVFIFTGTGLFAQDDDSSFEDSEAFDEDSAFSDDDFFDELYEMESSLVD